MSLPFPSPAPPPVITVSELNRTAKQLLEQALPLMWVSGEICDFNRAPSGHWYFGLKDRQAQVRCVLFRHKSQYLDFTPKNGMQVEVRAFVTLYEPRGDFQLSVETMRQAGLGALYAAFERLKRRLGDEGLFEEKRPLPAFPRQVGIVTSPSAAALRDVLTTLRRRMPSLPLVLYPTPVQGRGAAAQIAHAIATASGRGECDVLIVCRGGGSIEDLWEFNEEAVARAIRACRIPVVTGVGHETDFTIADFAADRRAPTPTAAAEMVAPSRDELGHRLAALAGRLDRYTQRALELRMQQVDYLGRRLTHPGERLRNRQVHVEHLASRLSGSMGRALQEDGWRLRQLAQRLYAARPDPWTQSRTVNEQGQRLAAALARTLGERAGELTRLRAHLDHLNPLAVLERGYAIALSGSGEIVRDSAQLEPGASLRVTFARGAANTRVLDTDGPDDGP